MRHMKREIELRSRKISYVFKKNKRAKRATLAVSRSGEVSITVPWFVSEKSAREFILEKTNWLLDKLEYFKSKPLPIIPPADAKDYLKYKKLAYEIAESKIKRFNLFYGFSFAKISVRNQKSRWGSCSKSGNLSFNYRIIFLPELMCDYIIIHELCHLGEFNHSKKFWNLVFQSVPNFKELRKKIRKEY